jgi:DNA-binding transcriptional LysR family regulator
MTENNWDHLRTFLRAAESLSFTAAARTLSISQPTVSRRVEELESDLGAALFVRHSRGLELTDRGAQLYEDVRGLDQRVREVFRRTRRAQLDVAGTVRLSVNEPLAIYALPGALRTISREYPEIQLEVVVENGTADLSRRDADLAVRMFRPTQGDLIASKVGSVEVGLFASAEYLERRPVAEPFHPKDHVVLGMDADPSWPRMLQQLGYQNQDFCVRTDSLILQLEAARNSVGIVGTHLQIGRSFGLVRVLPDAALAGYEVWIVRHEALRNDLAVRAVAAQIETCLRDYLGSTGTLAAGA